MWIPLLSYITTRLAATSDTPALDASVLVAHIVNKPRTWVMAHPGLSLTNEQRNKLNALLARLESGEPFPYVLGHWEFFGMEFDITPEPSRGVARLRRGRQQPRWGRDYKATVTTPTPDGERDGS